MHEVGKTNTRMEAQWEILFLGNDDLEIIDQGRDCCIRLCVVIFVDGYQPAQIST